MLPQSPGGLSKRSSGSGISSPLIAMATAASSAFLVTGALSGDGLEVVGRYAVGLGPRSLVLAEWYSWMGALRRLLWQTRYLAPHELAAVFLPGVGCRCKLSKLAAAATTAPSTSGSAAVAGCLAEHGA